MTATQLTIIMPALLFWIMLTVQYGLWFHAKQVASAAAADAVQVARTADADPGAGEAAARSFLLQAGNLENVTVDVKRQTEQVVVVVHGSAPHLVPGIAWTVTAMASAPAEEFRPEGR